MGRTARDRLHGRPSTPCVPAPGTTTTAENPGAGLLDRQDIVAGDLELDLHGERFIGRGVVQHREPLMDHSEVIAQLYQLRVTHQEFPRLHQIGG